MHTYINTYTHNLHLSFYNFIPEGEMEFNEADQLKRFKKGMGKMVSTTLLTAKYQICLHMLAKLSST